GGGYGRCGSCRRLVPDLERVRRAALAPGAADARVGDLADGDVAPAVLRQIGDLDGPLALVVGAGRVAPLADAHVDVRQRQRAARLGRALKRHAVGQVAD